MTKKKPPAKKSAKKPSDPTLVIARYEEVFGEIAKFVAMIAEQDEAVRDAANKVTDIKAQLAEAQAELNSLRDFRDGSKHNLYRYLAPDPKSGEILPLFDQMEEADEEKHGVGSDEWRKEPLAALKLSLPALMALNDAEVILVGQLQDRVLAEPESWWEPITGLSMATAAAIVDRLNDFILEQGRK